jgi:hypothetical protein
LPCGRDLRALKIILGSEQNQGNWGKAQSNGASIADQPALAKTQDR